MKCKPPGPQPDCSDTVVFFPYIRPLKAKMRDRIKRHSLLLLEPVMRVRLRISRCP